MSKNYSSLFMGIILGGSLVCSFSTSTSTYAQQADRKSSKMNYKEVLANLSTTVDLNDEYFQSVHKQSCHDFFEGNDISRFSYEDKIEFMGDSSGTGDSNGFVTFSFPKVVLLGLDKPVEYFIDRDSNYLDLFCELQGMHFHKMTVLERGLLSKGKFETVLINKKSGIELTPYGKERKKFISSITCKKLSEQERIKLELEKNSSVTKMQARIDHFREQFEIQENPIIYHEQEGMFEVQGLLSEKDKDCDRNCDKSDSLSTSKSNGLKPVNFLVNKKSGPEFMPFNQQTHLYEPCDGEKCSKKHFNNNIHQGMLVKYNNDNSPFVITALFQNKALIQKNIVPDFKIEKPAQDIDVVDIDQLTVLDFIKKSVRSADKAEKADKAGKADDKVDAEPKDKEITEEDKRLFVLSMALTDKKSKMKPGVSRPERLLIQEELKSWTAAEQDLYDQVMIKKNLGLNERIKNGDPLADYGILHLAVIRNSPTILKRFLTLGGDANATCGFKGAPYYAGTYAGSPGYSYPALYWAILANRGEIAKMLVDSGKVNKVMESRLGTYNAVLTSPTYILDASMRSYILDKLK